MKVFLPSLLIIVLTSACETRKMSDRSDAESGLCLTGMSIKGLCLYDSKAKLIKQLGEPDSVYVEETVKIDQEQIVNHAAKADSTWQEMAEVLQYECYVYNHEHAEIKFAICNDSAFFMNIELSGSTLQIAYLDEALSNSSMYDAVEKTSDFQEGTIRSKDGPLFKTLTFYEPIVEHTEDEFLIDFYDKPILTFEKDHLIRMSNFPGVLSRLN